MATFTGDATIGESGQHNTFLLGTNIWQEGNQYFTHNFSVENTTAGPVSIAFADVNGVFQATTTAAGATDTYISASIPSPVAGAVITRNSVNSESLVISGNSTVLIDGSTVMASDLNGGAATATLQIRNGGTLMFGDSAGPAGANNQQLNVDFNDFLVTGTLSEYTFHGAFNTTTPPRHQIQNGSFLIPVNQTDTTEQYYLWFAGEIATNSNISNVSLWNGRTGTEAKGAVFGLTTAAHYSGLELGPFGLWTNSENTLAAERIIIRFSNQGDTTLIPTNHVSFVGNLDFRSLSTVTAGDRSWAIEVDTQSHPWLINPYVGRPTLAAPPVGGGATILNNGRLAFIDYFNLTVEAEARILTGTNPVKTGSGTRRFTFTQTDVNATTSHNDDANTVAGGVDAKIDFANRVILAPETLPVGVGVGNVPTDITSQVVDDVRTGGTTDIHGILFQQQMYTGGTGTNVNATVARRQSIVPLVEKTYRVYDWLQQPTNAEFGTEITLTPPAEGATDAQITAAVAAGYDTFDGGFTTSTALNYTEDLPVTESGFTEATIVAETTNLNTKSLDTVAACSKFVSWAEAGTPNGDNDKINLVHSYDGTTLDFGVRDVTLSGNSWIDTAGGETLAVGVRGVNANATGTFDEFTVYAQEITQSELLTSITTHSSRSIILDAFANSSTVQNKVELTTGVIEINHETNITDPGPYGLTMTASTRYTLDPGNYRSCTFNGGANTTLGLGSRVATFNDCTFSELDISGSAMTFTNCTFDNDIDFRITTTDTSVTLDDVFGTGYTVGSSANIVLVSDTAVSLQVPAATLPTGISLGTSSNITLIPPAVTETISISRDTAGYYGITTGTTTETVLTDVTRFTASTGNTITTSLTNVDYTNGDTINFYIKYDSDVANTTIYNAQKIVHSFGSGNRTIEPPDPVSSALVSNIVPSRSTTTFSIDPDTVVTNALITILGASGTSESLFQTQGLSAEIANTQKYFETFFDNRLSDDIILWSANANVQWNRDVVTFQSGDTTTSTLPNASGTGSTAVSAPSVQLLGNWTSVSPDPTITNSVFSLSRAGTQEISVDTGGEAPLTVVADAARNGINSSSVIKAINTNSDYVADVVEANPILSAPSGITRPS